MKPILEVHNVSKKFEIDHERSSYLSLRDRIAGVFKPKSKKEDFWALKDVSFEVAPGESIGIIGSNGAGKSTLLKILSRITPPTKGSITVRGRIASLLEVGTGFHQELTGRENIFMNGSILGMKNVEIKKRFDEIVDFSGVEKFLDTPLKNYSSGMQLRLAFAVAAHLDPEILIIDEVLAVGDAEFQRKCIRRMEVVSNEGRTVIFVSHSTQFMRSLCERIIWMNGGRVHKEGNIDLIDTYTLSSIKDHGSKPPAYLKLSPNIFLEACRLTKDDIQQFDDLTFTFRLKSESENKIHELAIIIHNNFEQRVSIFDLRWDTIDEFTKTRTSVTINGHIKNLPLVPGNYFASLYINSKSFTGNTEYIFTFSVRERINGHNFLPYPISSRGVLDLIGDFNYE